MHRPHVRAMYAALGDFVYVIGGAKSCREVEKLDITTVESAWKHCPVSESRASGSMISPEDRYRRRYRKRKPDGTGESPWKQCAVSGVIGRVFFERRGDTKLKCPFVCRFVYL